MKATIKTVLVSAICSLLAFSAVTYSSCKRDKCKSLNCAYGGICKDGLCSCQSGYEGGLCETVTRDKFLGAWSVTETGTMTHQPAAYTVSITKSGIITDVNIHNFYNILTEDVYATVHGDSIIITQQRHNGRTIEGYGYLDNDIQYQGKIKLTMHYAVKIDSSGIIDDYGLHPEMHGSPSSWLLTSN